MEGGFHNPAAADVTAPKDSKQIGQPETIPKRARARPRRHRSTYSPATRPKPAAAPLRIKNCRRVVPKTTAPRRVCWTARRRRRKLVDDEDMASSRPQGLPGVGQTKRSGRTRAARPRAGCAAAALLSAAFRKRRSARGKENQPNPFGERQGPPEDGADPPGELACCCGSFASRAAHTRGLKLG